MAKEKPKGPKGGVKHQPGRGHDRKSEPLRKKLFAEKQRKKRQTGGEDLRKRWEEWDTLIDDAKKLLPDLQPSEPRPGHDD